jgi:hypothetical protein
LFISPFVPFADISRVGAVMVAGAVRGSEGSFNSFKGKKMNTGVVLAFGLLTLLGGCSPSYEILHKKESEGGVYLAFPAGSYLEEGEMFRIVGAAQRDAHGRLRPVLGKVKVLEVMNDTVAFVKVLEGTVEDGVSAERIK